ncbi:MAG: MaoC family dehydratase N-terminal domain-containing protein [Chloroflexi bacterium]|uniref:MaoC family dehydratase N-terminal domain-containing protein n=1 Tax=Candidatus Chlorohelix allophototropha TaxID=3003348 RepID=A0A8T7M6D9_9CHLR|nr:MaoC family dehydratase N-terminal domain-containing protein [Chloroflexota bacterium]WJW69580.1 MaoC family dehydratase N-terminal domain-containing protein [Chloroflexota bacterium L227-S17]
MINREKIGQPLSVFTYHIEPVKIKELAEALGDSNPIYYDLHAAVEAGYPKIPISPTFPILFGFWDHEDGFSILENLNIPMSSMLHGEEEYTYLAPVYAEDTITGTVRMTKVDEKQGSTGPFEVVTFEFDYFNQHHEPVLHTRQVAVIH